MFVVDQAKGQNFTVFFFFFGWFEGGGLLVSDEDNLWMLSTTARELRDRFGGNLLSVPHVVPEILWVIWYHIYRHEVVEAWMI